MILVIPGFFSLIIIRNLGQLKRKLKDSELFYWSLACSLVVYLFSAFIMYFFGIIENVDIDNIEIMVSTIIKPIPLLLLLITLLGSSFLIGLIIRLYRSSKNIIPYDTWTSVIQEERDSDWVLIHTMDGDEYEGIIHYYGIDDEPRDVSLINPIKIIRDENFNYDEELSYYIGEEIYFNSSNIKRIIFLDEKKERSSEKMSEDENKYKLLRIQLTQNSVFAWLAIGIGSGLSIFELKESGLFNKSLIFEILILLCVFSFERIVSHMNDILEIRKSYEELSTPSIRRLTSRYMEKFFIIMNENTGLEITFYVMLFIISHIFWYDISSFFSLK